MRSRFGEVCFCCSQTVLPGPAWVLLMCALRRIKSSSGTCSACRFPCAVHWKLNVGEMTTMSSPLPDTSDAMNVIDWLIERHFFPLDDRLSYPAVAGVALAMLAQAVMEETLHRARPVAANCRRWPIHQTLFPRGTQRSVSGSCRRRRGRCSGKTGCSRTVLERSQHLCNPCCHLRQLESMKITYPQNHSYTCFKFDYLCIPDDVIPTEMSPCANETARRTAKTTATEFDCIFILSDCVFLSLRLIFGAWVNAVEITSGEDGWIEQLESRRSNLTRMRKNFTLLQISRALHPFPSTISVICKTCNTTHWFDILWYTESI